MSRLDDLPLPERSSGGTEGTVSRGDAERRVAEVFAAGSREDLVHAYAGWAGRYDEDILSLDLRGPEIVAALAARHLEDRTSPILDAGAGTGRIGALLAILGYGHLVALDLSAAMLARARERGAYRELHEGALGDPLPFAAGTFAAVVAAGVFTAGHAPPDSFDELLRVTRPGGLLVFTLSTTAYGRGGFKDKIDALQAEGRWRLVEATAPFVGMPASTAYQQHTARVLVFQAGS
jgi:SAM-dependent methyltransferase